MNAKSNPNATTYYVWDERGENIIEIRYPEGLTEYFSYRDIAGQSMPTKHIAPDGVTTTLSYNVRGLPITMQRGDQNISVAYDNKQRPIKWTNQLNQTITAIYDDSQQQVIYQLYDGQQIVNQYDTEGQLVNRQWLDDKGEVLIDSGMVESNITKESKPIHKNMAMALDSIQVMTPLDIPIVKYPREQNQWLANIAEIESTTQSENQIEFNPVEQLIDLTPKVDPSQILADKRTLNQPQALPSNAVYSRLYDDFKRLVYNHDINTDLTVIEYSIGDQPVAIKTQTNHQTATYDLIGIHPAKLTSNYWV